MKTRDQQIQAIREVLMKYCDPKPWFDGVTAYEIATIIMREVTDVEVPT